MTADSSNPTNAPTGLSYPADFRPFSGERLFTSIGNLITEVTFFVPGSVSTSATVSAFGLVFSDLEFSNLTKFELFDSGDSVLLSHFVLNEATSGGYSFFGAQANAGERIAKVRITAGDLIVHGNNNFGGVSDTVLLDDVIYAEPLAPAAIPEPSTVILLLLLLLLLLLGWVGAVGLMGRRSGFSRR